MQSELPQNRLKELRLARGLRHANIAVQCDVDASTVWRWEQGTIPAKHLEPLAKYLDTHPAVLAGLVDEDELAA